MPSDVSVLSSSYTTPTPASLRGTRTYAAPPVGRDRCRDILGDVMRQTVISRLRLAHPAQAGHADAPQAEPAAWEGGDSVDAFVQALRAEPQKDVDRRVEHLSERSGIERFMLDLLPRAEIRLTELGQETAGDAFDITLARCRLQEIVERHHGRIAPPRGGEKARHGQARTERRRALISSDEPESFHIRLQIAADVLARDGWDVCCEGESPITNLVDLVRGEWFAIAVVACESRSVEALASAIRALRRASANADLRVLVMSAPLVQCPERLVRVGADAAAADIRQASLQAERLLTLMPPRARTKEARG